jgi:hypothetical protein
MILLILAPHSHIPVSTSARASCLTAGALAKAMRLKDRTRIERLIGEQQSVSAGTAMLLRFAAAAIRRQIKALS